MKVRYGLLLLLVGITAVVLTRYPQLIHRAKALVNPEVVVMWNEGAPLTRHHAWLRVFWEEAGGEFDIIIVDDLVIVDASHMCGDDCGASNTLQLRDNGAGQLPDFVSYHHDTSTVFSPDHSFSLRDGTIMIQEWDINGIISGYVERDYDKGPRFYFWHNFAVDDLLSRHLNGEIISDEELINALQADDLIVRRDALFVTRGQFPYALILPLIEALADVTPIPHDGSHHSQWRYMSNEVAFTLGTVSQKIYGGTYFFFRDPLTDYIVHDWSTLSTDPPPPTAERIAEIQANWRTEFGID